MVCFAILNHTADVGKKMSKEIDRYLVKKEEELNELVL